MNDGIYHVNFSSNSNSFGEGIVVFQGNSVNGGDSGYLYTGTKSDHDGKFTAKLTIKQWNSAAESVFGPIKEFVLELTGSMSGDGAFLAQGQVTGQPQAKITIRGRYLSAAA